jgi:hypothetical protein
LSWQKLDWDSQVGVLKLPNYGFWYFLNSCNSWRKKSSNVSSSLLDVGLAFQNVKEIVGSQYDNLTFNLSNDHANVNLLECLRNIIQRIFFLLVEI